MLQEQRLKKKKYIIHEKVVVFEIHVKTKKIELKQAISITFYPMQTIVVHVGILVHKKYRESFPSN